MAQASANAAILNNLITSIASKSKVSDPRRIRKSKDASVKALKTQQHTRTNQFEVDATVEGLIDKYSIINRDDLAEALSKRLVELRRVSKSRWTPEILSLFLNLSDRPELNTTLESLELCRPPTPPAPPVTWEELEAEEPLTGELWEEESYSSFSEDEIESIHDESSDTSENVLVRAHAPSVVKPVNAAAFHDLKAAQSWREPDLRDSRPKQVTELQVIREVIAMLHGLPTSLFTIDRKNNLLFHSVYIAISEVSTTTLNDALQIFASIGSDLLRLRTWTKKPQSLPVLQAFNAVALQELRQFAQAINDIDQQIASPSTSVVVSLVDLQYRIETLARPYQVLSQLAAGIPETGGDFICLELLYDQICLSQAAGDDVCYKVLGDIFFDCLKVYLRPVSMWMTEGTIRDHDDGFFIALADKTSSQSALWHHRYTLRLTPEGTLHAPSFLHPAASKILNAGKSIVFLQQLKRDVDHAGYNNVTTLTFETVCGESSTSSLMPFSELFNEAFTGWIGSRYGPASSILKEYLFDKCELLRHLETLEYVYFSKDGVRFRSFSDEVFKRMDTRKADWCDKFLLSELARRTFGGVQGIKAGAISVRAAIASHSLRSVKALRSISLDVALPWPIQNVIQRSSIATYQNAFCLLLQIQRACHLLQQVSIDRQAARRSHLRNVILHRLTWFTNVLYSHITETVLQPATEQLHQALQRAEDVDGMCELHERFATKLDAACLLAKNLAPIHDSIISMLDLAVLFHDAHKQPANARDSKSATSASSRKARRGKRRHRTADDSDHDDSDGPELADDESGDHTDDDMQDVALSKAGASYEERLQTVNSQFSQLLHFVVAGLRGVSRAGSEPTWEMLAERLEWGTAKVPRSNAYG